MPRLDRRRANPSPANICGERLRRLRLKQRYNQTELASLVQAQLQELYPGFNFVLDQTDVSRMETGKRPIWDFELRCLALALKVRADLLLGLDDEPCA